MSYSTYEQERLKISVRRAESLVALSFEMYPTRVALPLHHELGLVSLSTCIPPRLRPDLTDMVPRIHWNNQRL
jgi:hypothetical protein